jgi:hypothetical protein
MVALHAEDLAWLTSLTDRSDTYGGWSSLSERTRGCAVRSVVGADETNRHLAASESQNGIALLEPPSAHIGELFSLASGDQRNTGLDRCY